MADFVPRTAAFLDWQWDVASRVRAALERSYASRLGEVACVEAMVRELVGDKIRIGADGTRITLEAASTFLHGHRSQVKFSIGGRPYQRELADLLVLTTFVEGGRLQWQRACFIQAKRGGVPKGRAASRLAIEKGQLMLLGTFPEFEGVSGHLAGLRCRLRDSSGMLGAYGFLFAPGDMTVLSARVLTRLLGGRKSVTAAELAPILAGEASTRATLGLAGPARPLDPDNCPICREIVEMSGPPFWHHAMHRHHPLARSRGNSTEGGVARESALSCLGLDEFVDLWTTLQLGELWLARSAALGDRALGGLLFTLVSRVAQATDALSLVRGLMADALGNDIPTSASDASIGPGSDGGMAVVSVTVSRGEEG